MTPTGTPEGCDDGPRPDPRPEPEQSAEEQHQRQAPARGASPRHLASTALRAPLTAAAWRETFFIASGLPVALVTSTTVLTLASVALALLPTTVLALPFLAALYWCGRRFTGWQLARFRALLGVDIPPPPPAERQPVWWRSVWVATKSAGNWRRLAYHALSLLVDGLGCTIVLGLWLAGVVFGTIALWSWAWPAGYGLFGYSVHGVGRIVALTVCGLAALLLAPWAAQAAVRLNVALAHGLLSLSGKDQLTRRVETLTQSRTEMIDAADAERRRIERDLHDGAQQRLVSLALNLGMTRTTLTEVPESVRTAIEQAHDEAKLALEELRDFVRGLHPAVLDEMGLDAALSGITARSPVPVRLLVELPERPPRAVETVAYFVVSEALTNVAKHAQARRVDIVVEQDGGLLRVIVSDDGRGGADPSRGSGLRGLGQRVRSLDGTMSVDSPAGGPTLLVVELPCAS
ncbi:sensor histidine kinase [Actinospica robiniae]|uniref:sensor histidine kinase n=1 Tax=Actinospica robiniae TaxID=304901 RepID=UPI000418A168|nr:sensor histidine kinase [Actinospica robiniae]